MSTCTVSTVCIVVFYLSFVVGIPRNITPHVVFEPLPVVGVKEGTTSYTRLTRLNLHSLTYTFHFSQFHITALAVAVSTVSSNQRSRVAVGVVQVELGHWLVAPTGRSSQSGSEEALAERECRCQPSGRWTREARS